MPLMGDPAHDDMVAYLKNIEDEIGRPDAIVVVSAHWEAAAPTITAAPQPELFFDYYGFPPETYELTYPALGSVALAEKIHHLLDAAGLQPQLDHERGFDHGVFIPLMLMYPDAEIPVVQVSLVDGLDAASHIALGEALRPITDDGDVLVIGSGMSFHNMGAFGSAEHDEQNLEFDSWLESVCTSSVTDEATRRSELVGWESAPAARYNHPREEHLLPLHVCYGVGGAAASRSFTGNVLGKRTAAFHWS